MMFEMLVVFFTLSNNIPEYTAMKMTREKKDILPFSTGSFSPSLLLLRSQLDHSKEGPELHSDGGFTGFTPEPAPLPRRAPLLVSTFPLLLFLQG